MARLQISGLTCRFGSTTALNALSLTIEPGALYCLLGPSGCGKTTLLRLIAGYEVAEHGQIWLDGDDITHRVPERRDIGMVFQHYALFPHLSARDNVAFGLRARGMARSERRERVEAMLDRVGLKQAERARRPRSLSGGQQQRVALARALVIEPRLLLLDEPMANLDRRLREQMREEIRVLQQRTGVTTLCVTHDQEEALSLASQVGVMMDGALVQSDTPDTLYHQPADERTARFLGEANLLPVHDADRAHWYLPGAIVVAARGRALPSRVMIRPEAIHPVAPGAEGFAARIERVVFLGPDQLLDVRLADDIALRVRMRRSDGPDLCAGMTLRLAVDSAAVWPLA